MVHFIRETATEEYVAHAMEHTVVRLNGVTNAALHLLHYPAQWFESDLLDEQFLQQQLDRYQDGTDRNAEHYRYAAFRRILSDQRCLDEETLRRYIELARLDEDRTMAESALVDLLKWCCLTDEQLDRLSNHPLFQSPTLQRIGRRQKLRRELRARGPTDELVERIVASNDTFIQRDALSRRDLTARQLALLRDRGATKAVRNIAKAELRHPHRRFAST